MNPFASGVLSGMFNGVEVFVSPLAVKVEHKVVKSPIRKRRRSYRVEKQMKPAAIMALGRLIVHPIVWEQIKSQGNLS